MASVAKVRLGDSTAKRAVVLDSLRKKFHGVTVGPTSYLRGRGFRSLRELLEAMGIDLEIGERRRDGSESRLSLPSMVISNGNLGEMRGLAGELDFKIDFDRGTRRR